MIGAKSPLAGGNVVSQAPIVEPSTGRPTREYLKHLQDSQQRLQNGLDTVGNLISTVQGLIAAAAQIEGRTEGIGTTVQNITPVGQLNSLLNVAADRNLDHIDDTTSFQRTNPNQVTGAQRGFNALDSNSKLPGASATPNMQLNATNFCTVVGTDLGANAGCNIYGTGGPGTQWTGQVGTQTTGPFPAGSISGLDFSTTYVCYYDSINQAYVATIDIPSSLNDYYVYAGTFTTPASGGGGGATFVVHMKGTIPTQQIDYVEVTAGGSFTGTPTLTFAGGGSSGGQATAHPIMGGGAITGVIVDTNPSVYSSAPSLTAAGGTSGNAGGGGTTGGTPGRTSLAGLNLQ